MDILYLIYPKVKWQFLVLCVVSLGVLWYEIVDADWELTYQAAIFKSKGGLSYPDCYTAALGKLRQAEVVTGDPEFQKLRRDITIRWEEG